MSTRSMASAARSIAEESLARAKQGDQGDIATGNTSSLVSGAPLTGTAVTFSTTLTPKTGGKLSLSGFLSGTGTAGQTVTAQLRINGTAIRTMTTEIAPGGGWSIALSGIDSNVGAGYPIGTAVTGDIHASATGSLTVPTGQAGITMQEVPL